MNSSFKNHKYLIIAGLISLAVIYLLYPRSSFDGIKMEITRYRALKIAEEYLEKQNIDVSGFMKEAFVDQNQVENKYLLRKLGNQNYKKLLADKKWYSFGWLIMFHKNLSRELPQTIYHVKVSSKGNVAGFRREIPDTTKIPSLNKEEAQSLIQNTIEKNLEVNLSSFELVESREENYSYRTDYSYRWEKNVKNLNGKIVIGATVQGNQPGRYGLSFEVPETDRQYFNTTEALFSTVSIIFVVFLMVYIMFLFLKKYHQGEVWINVGRTLFLIYFAVTLTAIVNEWPNTGMSVSIGNLSFLITKIIVMLLNGLLVYFLLALLIFASWAVGESYGRELWPEKLNGTDSIVKGHLFTISAGSSLMKGMILGLLVAAGYLAATVFLNTPESTIFISTFSNIDIFGGYVPLIGILAEGFGVSTVSSIVVTFFTVNLTYQKWHNKWLSILTAGFVTMLANVIAVTPPSLNNFGMNLIVYLLFGIFAGYIYIKFDLLTILSMNFYSVVIYRAFNLYPATAPYYNLNFGLLVAALMITPLIYIISRMKKEEFILEDYGLPSHIEKITERARLRKELEIAAKVQLSLLPKERPEIKGYEIASFSLPAKEAGGDYYDFVKLSDNKLGIAIGDVSGKGIGAAIYMTLTKGILQAHAEENVSPKTVLGKVNKLLYKTIEKNSFVSMFYAILDTVNHTLLYSRAGHNPGIFCSREEGNSKLLMSKGIALGLEEGIVFQQTLLEDTINVSRDDIVVLYTDGFTEAMNEHLQQYGEKRLIELIEKNRDKSPGDLLNLILKDVHKFTKDYPQHDDMTIVILKRQ